MQRALGDYVVAGTHTNLEYLRRIVAHPAFVRGDVDTSFVDKHHSDLTQQSELSEADLVDAVAAAALFTHAAAARAPEPSAPVAALSEWFGSTGVVRSSSAQLVSRCLQCPHAGSALRMRHLRRPGAGTLV